MAKWKYFPIEGVKSMLTLTMLFKEPSKRQHQIQLRPKVDGQHRHHQPMEGKYSALKVGKKVQFREVGLISLLRDKNHHF